MHIFSPYNIKGMVLLLRVYLLLTDCITYPRGKQKYELEEDVCDVNNLKTCIGLLICQWWRTLAMISSLIDEFILFEVNLLINILRSSVLRQEVKIMSCLNKMRTAWKNKRTYSVLFYFLIFPTM